jgi:hypothetical protein
MLAHMKATILIFVLAIAVSAQTRPQTRRPSGKPAQPPSTAPSTPLLPVTVKLKSGNDVTGKFAGANDHALTLTTDSGSQEIRLSDIATIQFSAEVPVATDAFSREAIKALRRLDSAVSVGLTYREYGTRLVDTKVAVDEQLEKVAEGELKMEIMRAMSDYKKASQLWELKVTESKGFINGGFIERSSSDLKALVQDYPEVSSIAREESVPGVFLINIDEMLNVIWRSARKHIDKATGLLT